MKYMQRHKSKENTNIIYIVSLYDLVGSVLIVRNFFLDYYFIKVKNYSSNVSLIPYYANILVHT